MRLVSPALSNHGIGNFPAIMAPTPTSKPEWWYVTGNLATKFDRRFGFQFTIFRRALSPDSATTDSEFRSNNIYMAHFTLSDMQADEFYHAERYARGGAGLAGARTAPNLRVWLEDWQLSAVDVSAESLHITAASDNFSIDLRLQQTKPPALQGIAGLSQKSAALGNASHYYSLTRLQTAGELHIGGQSYQVSGLSWLDHEFSTSALGADAQGWDWFGLIFDDGSELMVGQIRLTEGGIEPAFGGLLVLPDGSARALSSEQIDIQALAAWRSPHSGADYPAEWQISIRGEVPFSIRVSPLMADQELHGAGIVYWEGAVQVSGDKSGYGYAELTGYAGSMRNRF